MNKLGRDETVTTDILAKICRSLNCTMGDFMTVVPGSRIIKRKSILWDA